MFPSVAMLLCIRNFIQFVDDLLKVPTQMSKKVHLCPSHISSVVIRGVIWGDVKCFVYKRLLALTFTCILFRPFYW